MAALHAILELVSRHVRSIGGIDISAPGTGTHVAVVARADSPVRRAPSTVAMLRTALR